MSHKDNVISILYDISQTIGSEVKLSSLLKKLLQRLMYHTGYSCGLILSNSENGKQCIEVAIGDIGLKKSIGKVINNPSSDGADITSLPVRQNYYHSILKLPIPNYGDILLLAVEAQSQDTPFEQMFAPLLSNLHKTITLCKDSEAYTGSLLKDKEELTEANLLFRQSLDTSSDFIILVDLKSNSIIDFNKSTAKTLGYTKEEINELNLANLFCKDTFKNFTKSVGEIKSTQESIVSEFNFINKKGKIFPIEASLSLLITEDKPAILIIVASDITERKKAETELFNAQQLSETTLNSIGDAVITTNSKGFVDRMNPIAEELTGWKFKDAKGKNLNEVFKIVNASTSETIPNPVNRVIRTGETIFLSNHTTLISKDKSEYQIADSAAPIRSKGSGILGMVLVFNDVTEQYKLRQDILKREQDLQAIMDYSPAVIYVKDRDGHFIFINKEFENLFHINRKEILGKTLFDIFPHDIASEMAKNDKEVVTTGEVVKTEEIAPHNDGPHTYMSIKFPLKDNKNKIYASCGISTDITERVKIEEKLRRSLKMDALGQLTGGIAHDYNNMLGVVLGFTELLNIDLKDNPKLSGYLTNIRRASERGSILTKKLLSFSRKEAATSRPFNVNTLLEEEKSMLEKTLTARISLTLNLEENAWPIFVDSSDLEDAILNICINAMHSMKDSGKLTIKTKNETVDNYQAVAVRLHAGEYLKLSITDTGHGMDEETIEKIFDPFYTTKGEEGTGLGLSQVYGFVERSHGAIKVDSKIDKGTTFTIYFPKHHEIVKKGIETTTDTADLKGNETILVVDDEPALQSFTSVALSQQGYKVTCADSAKEALFILKEKTFDLMVSDVIMPEMNGFQLAEIVKEKYPKIKIQLVSGFNSNNDIDKLDKNLHKSLLAKPFTIVALLTKVRELLNS